MKELYEKAIKIISDIETIKMSIKIINQGVDDGSIEGRVLLRTEETVFCTYRYANVRPTTYVQFLNGELKDHQKDLKVIESSIKAFIN